MGKTRFLVSATLLLGACDVLWAAFQGENPAYCDPSSPACTSVDADGGIDLAVADDADGGAADSDAGSSDAAVGDGLQNPDLVCNPGTTSLWLADPTPPGAAAVALTGITGNGIGDVWTVGTPSYAAHRAASWSTIGLAGGLTLGRVVYAPKQAQALAVANGALGGSVVHLNTSGAGASDLVTLLTTTLTGIWVSAAPESLPYVVGSDASFKSFSGLLWGDVGQQSPVPLNAIAGSGMAATTAVWGVSAVNNQLVAYPGAAPWLSASTGSKAFNAVWVSANNGTLMVGNNGAIVTVAATLPPIKAQVAMTSPVTAALADVAGTADGKHLWAVGASGTIVHWESVCQIWTKETTPSAQDLSAIWVSDAEHLVWAVGANGTVLHRAIP